MAIHHKYADYKSSKVAWIGEVPLTWQVRRLKDLGRLFGGSGFPHELQNVQGEEFYFYKVGDLNQSKDGKTLLSSPHTISRETARQLRAVVIPKETVVYAKIGAALLLNRRRVTTAECCIDNNMTAYVPDQKRVAPDWAFYWLSAIDFGEHVNPGAIPSLSEGYQSILPIPVPPLDEQNTITRFLDYKTAQIDALIAKKQALLEKLAEKRTALISHSVTKGLDPSVPMKDSGVAWLGEIPMHWGVSKLSYLSESMQTGPFGSQLHAEEYVEGGVPLINPVDIANGQIFDNPKITVGDDVVERLARHKLELGDVVIARRGEMGRAGLVRENNVGWLCGTGSLRARLNQKIMNPEFLLYQFSMKGVVDYLSLQSVGSTMDNLNTTILGGLPVILPPIDEQKTVVSYLRKICDALDAQFEKVSQVISLLQEYRSALITNAVTGKIDVRNFEIPLTAKEPAHA